MWVYTYSGLASRCNTLAQVYYLLKKNRKQERLVLVWPLEEACGIHFWEIFAEEMFADINFRVIEINIKRHLDSTCGGVAANIRKGNYRKASYVALLKCVDYFRNNFSDKRAKLPMLVFGRYYFDFTPPEEIGWFGESFFKYSKHVSEEILRALSKKREIYIKAYNGIFYDEEREKADYSVIRFKEEYWNKVQEIVGSGGGYIGVHIRRTDHGTAIKESSTNAFIHKMDEIVRKQTAMKFFLATDDKKEEEILQKIYGDKIVVQPDKVWGREGSDEMKSGIIDCLCLSRCEYILGSYGSSYSRFAARYGSKELLICRDS